MCHRFLFCLLTLSDTESCQNLLLRLYLFYAPGELKFLLLQIEHIDLIFALDSVLLNTNIAVLFLITIFMVFIWPFYYFQSFCILVLCMFLTTSKFEYFSPAR